MNNLDMYSSAMIVPTRGSSRGVHPDVLMKRWSEQSWLPDEVIIVRGAPNPAIGRNLGVSSTSAELLIFADDDGQPCHSNTLESVVKALIDDETIWLSGAAIRQPQDASWFQKAYVKQVPTNSVKIPLETIETDLHTSVCCKADAIRRQHFDQLGGFDERLTAGEDPELRDRLRKAGGRVVLAGGAGVFHPPPKNLQALWRKGYWYGKGEAQVAVLFRGEQWLKETRPKGFGYILMKALASPACLLLNWTQLRTGKIRFGFQPLRMIHTWAITAGYVLGRIFKDRNKRQESAPVVAKYKFPIV